MRKQVQIYSMVGLLLLGSDAYAYLDPGTGSMLLQGLIAGVAAGLVIIKLYWYKVKAFLFRRSNKPESLADSRGDSVLKKDDAR